MTAMECYDVYGELTEPTGHVCLVAPEGKEATAVVFAVRLLQAGHGVSLPQIEMEVIRRASASLGREEMAVVLDRARTEVYRQALARADTVCVVEAPGWQTSPAVKYAVETANYEGVRLIRASIPVKEDANDE